MNWEKMIYIYRERKNVSNIFWLETLFFTYEGSASKIQHPKYSAHVGGSLNDNYSINVDFNLSPQPTNKCLSYTITDSGIKDASNYKKQLLV